MSTLKSTNNGGLDHAKLSTSPCRMLTLKTAIVRLTVATCPTQFADSPDLVAIAPILLRPFLWTRITTVPTTIWANNLKGLTYTSRSGDHILPALDNAMVVYDSHHHSSGVNTFTLKTNELVTHMLVPAGEESATFNSKTKLVSFGDLKLVWHGSKQIALMTSAQGGSAGDSTTKLVANDIEANDSSLPGLVGGVNQDGLLMLHADKNFAAAPFTVA